MSKYSKEEIEAVRVWYLTDGLSDEQIARKRGLGESRNAIIGLRSRNDIFRRDAAGRKFTSGGAVAAGVAVRGVGPARTPTVPRPPRPARPLERVQTALHSPPELRRDPKPVVARAGTGPTLVDLEAGQCKNPVGDAFGAEQMFCGQPTPLVETEHGHKRATYCATCAPALVSKAKPRRADPVGGEPYRRRFAR